VAELADAQVSEACDGDIVEVQVLSSAPVLSSKPSESNRARFSFGTVRSPSRLIERCHIRRGRGVLLLTTLKARSQPGERPMKAEHADSIQSDRSSEERNPLRASGPQPFKITERPVRHRVQRLADLAHTLLREAEALAADKTFTEETNKLRTLNIAEGIDFYDEVKQFEINLIKLALERTGRNQAAAARLLHIKPTTLNFKIKLYGIEY
jgi:DNA-binding protein Fis